MTGFKSIFLAVAAATLAVSSPVRQPHKTDNGTVHIRSGPIFYTGPWQNFPSADTWLTYDELFKINKPYIAMTGSTEADIAKIDVAVRTIAPAVGVPERVLFSIIMQESHGDVGAGVTYSYEKIPTGGLMQCYTCPGYPDQYNLSQEQINSMIQGGAEHYKKNMATYGNTYDPSTIYPALREYNSGKVDVNNLSEGFGATNEYVSDISQRLGGWAD